MAALERGGLPGTYQYLGIRQKGLSYQSIPVDRDDNLGLVLRSRNELDFLSQFVDGKASNSFLSEG